MSWCDKLASTPSVGFKLDSHFAPSEQILQNLSGILDGLIDKEEIHFKIDKQDTFNIEFTTHSGFHYGFEPSRVYINFQHRIRARNVSGGPPTMELLSRALPFTELLPDVAARLIEATLLLPNARTRKVSRIGVVSVTIVSEDEIPPGIARFIKYAGRPWGNLVGAYSIQLASVLNAAHGVTDICTHTISKPEGPDNLVTLQFDWRREFDAPKPINAGVLNEETAKVQKAALDYFEDLAEGNRFDEDLLKTT